LSVWIKGIGLFGVLGAVLYLISIIADLKGLGIPISPLFQGEDLPIDISGLLTPDNAPTPSHSCLSGIPEDAIKIFAGQNLIYQTVFPISVLKMAGEDLLSIKKGKKGFLISAKIFSYDGKIVAQLEDNKFYINPHNYFRLERPNKYILAVHNQRAEKVLDIYFINSNTIRISGIFIMPNRQPIIVAEDVLKISGYSYAGLCFGEVGESMFNIK
jgi:hypothetical protein